jgi:hypothetical protein
MEDAAMSGKESTTAPIQDQAFYDRYNDAENWTPQQAAEYAEWLKNVKSKHLRNRKNSSGKRLSGQRPADVALIEADIIAGLRNASSYANMAELHAQVFDEVGFLYDLESFIQHAKLVSDYIKKYRDILEI